MGNENRFSSLPTGHILVLELKETGCVLKDESVVIAGIPKLKSSFM